MIKIIKIVFILCSLLLAASAIMMSCNKKETIGSPSSRLIGKWKKVRYATDDNANGQIDDWEIQAVDAGITNIMEFKKDSTGIESATFAVDQAFTWLITGEKSLVTVYNSGDSILYKLVLISQSNLHITTKTKLGLAGYYYDTYK